MNKEAEKLPFPTYDKYLLRKGNEEKDFNDYLVDYFKERAAPFIHTALSSPSQLGFFSRITNDLTSIHPEMSPSRVADQFITAVDEMDQVEPEYKIDVLKRWFYAAVNIITHLFLNSDGRIKERFLATLVGDKYKTIEDVKKAIYGNPPDPQREKMISTFIVGSAAVAVSQVLADDKTIQTMEKYRDRAYGLPEDEIRLKPFTDGITYDLLKNFGKKDFYLCRLSLFQAQIKFLSRVNGKVPEGQNIPELEGTLNSFLDRLFIFSPIAGTQDYNAFFNSFLRMLYQYEEELEKKNPHLKSDLQQFMKMRDACFNELRDNKIDRSARLDLFQKDLSKLNEEIEQHLQGELKASKK